MTQQTDQPASAIALRYDGQTTPTVTAKGWGESAEQIIALAKEHGVFIHEDPQLATLLEQLQLDQAIPRELYLVVAEIIAFVYTLQGRFPDKWTNHHNRVDDKV